MERGSIGQLVVIGNQLLVEPPVPPTPPPTPTYSASNATSTHPAAHAADGTQTTYWSASGFPVPQWWEANFGIARLVSGVTVYGLQDDWSNPVNPSDTMTFTKWGCQNFQAEANGVVLGAPVVGNTLVKRVITFAPVSIDRLRIVVTVGSPTVGDGFVRLCEIVPTFV